MEHVLPSIDPGAEEEVLVHLLIDPLAAAVEAPVSPGLTRNQLNALELIDREEATDDLLAPTVEETGRAVEIIDPAGEVAETTALLTSRTIGRAVTAGQLARAKGAAASNGAPMVPADLVKAGAVNSSGRIDPTGPVAMADQAGLAKAAEVNNGVPIRRIDHFVQFDRAGAEAANNGDLPVPTDIPAARITAIRSSTTGTSTTILTSTITSTRTTLIKTSGNRIDRTIGVTGRM